MSLPRYPEYKDSGVEWLGEVPAHWSVQRLSWMFGLISSGTTPPSENPRYYEGDICWVTTGELREAVITDTEKKVTENALLELSALRVYPVGTLLIALYGATIGRLGVLGVEACTNQACCALAYPINVYPRFIFYVLSASKEYLLLIASGGGQPNINQDKIRSLRVSVPALNDQEIISEFLDNETKKIDSLISEQEKLIALLKEKRQAVISHAVTKGLDPSVPMKDSGVEWLGEVPAHWDVTSLKRHWTATDCKHVTADFVEDGIPLASIREVQSRWVELADAKRTTEHYYELLIEGGRDPRPGDLIFSRNATVGEVAQVPVDHPPFAMGQDVVLLRRIESASSPDFLQLVIRSSVVTQQLAVCMIGSTFKRINVEEMRSLVIAFPPAEEQQKISTYLLEQVDQFDQLIEEAVLSIELLRERRSALVSAAVTGQIDVRQYKAKEVA